MGVCHAPDRKRCVFPFHAKTISGITFGDSQAVRCCEEGCHGSACRLRTVRTISPTPFPQGATVLAARTSSTQSRVLLLALRKPRSRLAAGPDAWQDSGRRRSADHSHWVLRFNLARGQIGRWEVTGQHRPFQGQRRSPGALRLLRPAGTIGRRASSALAAQGPMARCRLGDVGARPRDDHGHGFRVDGLGFAKISPRPRHRAKRSGRHFCFKKTSPPNWRSPSGRGSRNASR